MGKLFINGFSYLLGDATADAFAPFAQPRQLRRMETIAKNALLCSFRAFEQAGIDPACPKETGLSVAVGAGSLESTCKFMDTIIADGDELSSPTAFAGSVHNSTAHTLSVFLHLSGPSVTTGQFDFSFAGALLTAQQFMERGLCPDALVAVAEDINPVAAEVAPKHPALFASVVRSGVFTRAAAAFAVSLKPTAHTVFTVTKFEFAGTDNKTVPAQTAYSSAAYNAVETARLLSAGKAFSLRDNFGGAEMILEAEPYVTVK